MINPYDINFFGLCFKFAKISQAPLFPIFIRTGPDHLHTKILYGFLIFKSFYSSWQ